MSDFRLPYFYHLSLAVLLAIHVVYRMSLLFEYPDPSVLLLLKSLLMITPSTVASVYFFQQYQARNDMSLRETIFILVAANFLSYFLPGLLP